MLGPVTMTICEFWYSSLRRQSQAMKLNMNSVYSQSCGLLNPEMFVFEMDNAMLPEGIGLIQVCVVAVSDLEKAIFHNQKLVLACRLSLEGQ